MLNAQCSMLNAQCSMLNAQISMLNAQCSMFNSYIPSSFTPLSIYAPPPLLTERWGYSKRGLRRDGDDNDTSVAIHRGLDDTLVDSQFEYFVVIFRLLNAA